MRIHQRLGVAMAAALVLTGAAFAVDFDADCYRLTSHEIFTSGFQRFVTSKSTKGVLRKTTARPTAGLVGYRYSTPQLSAGLAVSYEAGNSRNYSDAGMFRLRDETIGVSLFSRYTGFSGWYAQSSLFGGYNRKEARDGVVNGVAISRNGRDSSNYFAATLELGRQFDLNNGLRITPHAGFNYSYAPSSELRVRENGAPARWDVDSQNFFDIPVGVTFAREFSASDWTVTPSVDLTLVGTVGGIDRENYNYRYGFAAYDGSKWQVHGVGSGRWGGRVTAGINALKADRFDVGVNYSYEGRKRYEDHRITAGVGVRF